MFDKIYKAVTFTAGVVSLLTIPLGIVVAYSEYADAKKADKEFNTYYGTK